jgi:hypothetical protein
MPSDYIREKLAPQESTSSYRDRTHSFIPAPDTHCEPFPSAVYESKSFHQSLPDIGYYGQATGGRVNVFDEVEQQMHHSMPNIAYTNSKRLSSLEEEDKKIPARDFVEPIPLHHLNIPPRPVVRKGEPEDQRLSSFKKANSLEDFPSSSSSGTGAAKPSGRLS